MADPLTVTKPINAEVWTRGNEYEIHWTGANNTDWDRLDIFAYKGAVSVSLIANCAISQAGTWYWTPATSLAVGTDYRILISEVDA